MGDKLFGMISTIAGLVVGWTLNELGFAFKSRRENRKVLNQVLFVQLEIRDVIRKTNLDAVEKQMTRFFEKKFPSDNVKGFQETVGKIFYGFIQNELNNKFSDKIQEIGKEYKNYITQLSQIDPMITYQISNKDTILDYLGYINDYLAGIEPFLNQSLIKNQPDAVEEPRTFNTAFEKIRDHITPFIRNEALSTIESDIYIVSKKISYFKFRAIKKFITQEGKLELDSFDLKKIEHYLNTYSSL